MLQRHQTRRENVSTPPGNSTFSRDRGGRTGFTLVELLIVVAIIALLMSILGVAVMSMIGSAKIAATKGTITKVQGLLQQRIESVVSRDPERVLVDSLTPRFNNQKRAEAMAHKFLFRQAFPQTWAELAANSPNLLALSGETPPMSATKAQSSEVLYFLLTKADVLGYPPEGTDVFSSAEVADTDGNGKMELIDAWGRPLRFYRWPTRLVRDMVNFPVPANPDPLVATPAARALIPSLPTIPADLTHDFDDKYGMLKAATVWRLSATDVGYFESGNAPMGHFLFKLGTFHTPDTFSMPLIVSGGPDLDTGLFEPEDTPNFGHLCQPKPGPGATPSTAIFDDISNYNIRSGGK